MTDTSSSEISPAFVEDVTCTVQNLTIARGEASPGGPTFFYGGAILANFADSVLNLTNTTFTDNHADASGGAVFSSGTLNILKSTFEGNAADQNAGAVYSRGILSVINTTFAGNSAAFEGGAILCDAIPLSDPHSCVVINSTFSGNSATAGGGALYNNLGVIDLTNTIIAGGAGGSNCAGTSITSHGHNVSSDGTCFSSIGTDLANTNPQLTPLGNYGGPTQTFGLCLGAGVPDPSCAAASPALDTGDNAACMDPATVDNVDQRGFPRFPAGGGTCDIGAFEVDRSALGSECTIANECDSGFCVSDVCCDTSCSGPLESCTARGQVGTCTRLVAPAPAVSLRGMIALVLVLSAVAALGMRRARA